MKRVAKTVSVMMYAMLSTVCIAANYPVGGDSTAPNTWSKNYDGVLAAAQQTHYPILIVMVNSATCGHCHTMIEKTVNSAEFAQMEHDLTYYEVIMDSARIGGLPIWSTVLNRYYSYFEGGMYPVVAVLRNDGSVYGAFGNRTTDKRNVSLDLRQMIETLAVEQGSDIWSSSGVEPFTIVSPYVAGGGEKTATQTSLTWAEKLKGRINGVVFDSTEAIVGSFVISLNARGKATVKFTTYASREMVKGELALNGDVPQIVSDGLLLSYDTTLAIWSGRWQNYDVYASALPSKSYNGLYTAAATNATESGYVSVTVKNGKGKVAGMVGGKNKISANEKIVVLPAAAVNGRLGRWGTGSDLAFVPMVKADRFSGGVAISKNGGVSVSFSAYGRMWSGAGAALDGSTDLSACAGKALRIMVGSTVFEVPVKVVNAKKITVGENDISARLSAMVRRGTFKGSAKISGASYRFEGVFLKDGQSISGIGISYGADVHRVEIGEPSAK